MSRNPALWTLLALAACSQNPMTWAGGPQPEDPAPSGSSYLRAYKESHYRALGQRVVETLDWDRFEAELRTKSVLYLGDHHADSVLHARYLEMLRELQARGFRLALGLEAVATQDSTLVQDFLRGELSLAGLREGVLARWPSSWLEAREGIDAPFYLSLLEFAQRTRSPLFALEPAPRLALAERESSIVARVRQAARKFDDRLIAVVLGHTHLLGDGDIVGRVGLPSATVAARMSVTLKHHYDQMHPIDGGFLRTDTGVLFVNPPSEGG